MPPAETQPGQTIRQARAIIKPVLSNPYATPWPSLPNHLQNGVMAALPQLVPDAVAEYHTDRARCSAAAKRARRKAKRAEMEVETETTDTTEEEKTQKEVPTPPEILDHLVLGLNETIRALEGAISALRMRMALLADSNPRFLPAQPGAEPEAEAAGITYLLVPHTSVSPLALVDPLPTYCATYNTLLRQASTIPNVKKGMLGQEIRIVPLGKREQELALAAGLRRITSIGVRASHPAVGVLERLLQAALAPPRHSMTLPWPTTRLTVYKGEPEKESEKGDKEKGDKEKGDKGEKGEKTAPHTPIAYAPLHIKAIHTTMPVDPDARKATRLAQVRANRVEKKTQRVAKRHEMERKVRSEVSGKFIKGRASRLADKAAKAAAMDVS
ncbi:hypothetical protein CcaverHIS002_0205230 [Cutaneotrichosporon cavernicola]|uniref:Uncharacterized protein n=1 Tax=Cutaneotrichosporon cavernicola TaxID=279322 RepID=A0AA48I4F2_9TREE|nr:uncharacterized protein CcaverHIS019_0205190 [Cutaneotrichosporon cavernicola]BEI81363.1 hypothetical protein CcaverHIS002_0205230 [Cutaneotrichosporon cavernicola]BEI89157.1 hypothetical protein CcaverHIS019_0205190 [Cutaneotrichosporon cavernicola]BEI96934.1 hypothetical protein CcaverHIS631_0205230 [Cutaneotrichosporon cavernicola]BEJ04706.1 hypothetical protein CcaverHIS641_0205230 [Cutaneotrichosporon cavernicola]